MSRVLSLIAIASMLAACASEVKRTPEQALESAKIHTELAASYYQRGQPAIALQEIDIALQANDRYAMAYSVRGLVRMALREDKEAEADFKRSVDLDAKNPDARNNYGWFLCERGREREAVQQFMEAVKNPLYQTPEKSYVNAGVCSKRLGELRDAENYLQRALVLKPNFPSALIALAELNFSLGDFALAKSYFLRFIQTGAELSSAHLLLGVRIERKLGDTLSAESYATQLRKRFPDSREAQLLNSGR